MKNENEITEAYNILVDLYRVPDETDEWINGLLEALGWVLEMDRPAFKRFVQECRVAHVALQSNDVTTLKRLAEEAIDRTRKRIQ